MNTAALRAQIQLALTHEASSGDLARQIAGQLEHLHPIIQLPVEGAGAALQGFVAAYVEQVPDMLDAANSVAREAGIEAQVKPVLKLAEQFFLSPPQIMDGQQGLAALLDEAYLAHRLVEEVNDRYIAHLGQPLIPLDTTVANVIAHRLIGEPFANQLDEAVHHALSGLLDASVFQQESVQEYRARLGSPQTLAAWQSWPCLSRQLGVELGLPLGA
ncbi:hypothetical protein AAFN46_12910 [Pseudomonas sp. CAU 1711]|uniref:hypothetical protein n=1 Tax=Pseudomonas sp. CAU 1711 TaxID=3140356 RepID=UPI003261CFD5